MDCNTENCNGEMETGLSKCDTGAYNIYDYQSNLKFQWKTHNISSDDDEIGTQVSCLFCQTCNLVEHTDFT